MDYIPLNNHMHVKNHMAMWFLWFLWFLRVECSSNPLYKPLCAFLVFVDLVWFLCGWICGFWSSVVFGFWSAHPIVLMWFLWIGGLALDALCRRLRVLLLFVGRRSCPRCSIPTVARPLALCGLLKRFAHCPTSCYVPFRRHWRRPFTNGENDHG